MPPEWWRGTTPKRLPSYGGALLSGEILEFDVASFPLDGTSLLRAISFQEAAACGINIELDELSLAVCWSEFERCTVRQRSGRLNAKGLAPQGSFGNRPSLYRDCTFTGVRFKTLGRFITGSARFVGCRFDRCHFNGHFSLTTDYIDCTFTGKIDGCAWSGTVPAGDAEAGRRNVITGNDFTGAELVNVGWRDDFDFSAQRWPAGYQPTAEQPSHSRSER
jgi:hypothetical protein